MSKQKGIGLFIAVLLLPLISWADSATLGRTVHRKDNPISGLQLECEEYENLADSQKCRVARIYETGLGLRWPRSRKIDLQELVSSVLTANLEGEKHSRKRTNRFRRALSAVIFEMTNQVVNDEPLIAPPPVYDWIDHYAGEALKTAPPTGIGAIQESVNRDPSPRFRMGTTVGALDPETGVTHEIELWCVKGAPLHCEWLQYFETRLGHTTPLTGWIPASSMFQIKPVLVKNLFPEASAKTTEGHDFYVDRFFDDHPFQGTMLEYLAVMNFPASIVLHTVYGLSMAGTIAVFFGVPLVFIFVYPAVMTGIQKIAHKIQDRCAQKAAKRKIESAIETHSALSNGIVNDQRILTDYALYIQIRSAILGTEVLTSETPGATP